MKKRLAIVLVVWVLASCGGKEPQPGNTIIDVLKADGRFTTLLRIVQKDAAVRFLDFMTSSSRHLTLFAPTDDAFDDLPPGKLQALLEDEDAIRDLLAHHLAEPTLRLAELQAKARSDDPLLPTGGCCRVRQGGGEPAQGQQCHPGRVEHRSLQRGHPRDRPSHRVGAALRPSA